MTAMTAMTAMVHDSSVSACFNFQAKRCEHRIADEYPFVHKQLGPDLSQISQWKRLGLHQPFWTSEPGEWRADHPPGIHPGSKQKQHANSTNYPLVN